jgi:hypothetical protein
VGWIDSVKPCEWDNEPLVPWALRLNCPVEAAAVAPKSTETLWPAAREKGLAGLVAEPAGSPVMVSWTLAEKPFWALMEMLTGELVPPCETVMDVAESAMEKSGEGGVVGTPPVPPPPPQAAVKLTMETKKS